VIFAANSDACSRHAKLVQTPICLYTSAVV